MAEMSKQTADAVVFQPKADRAPPANTTGLAGWLRTNLFYSWFSTLMTILGAYAIYLGFAFIWEWGVTNAVWEAQNRRECLNQNPDGACWAGVFAWFKLYVYGRYPAEEQWRINSAFLILVMWMVPLWLPRIKGKIGFGITAVLFYPFLAGYMFSGGERGWFMNTMVFMTLSVFTYNMLNVVSCLLSEKSLGERLVEMTGFVNKHESTHKYPVLIAVFALAFAYYIIYGGGELAEVGTNLWGGLFLTLVIAGIGIVTALPGGVVLALARRSKMPVIRICSTAFIELFRSVPLITVLFMAVTMMPLFLPEGFQLNKLVQAIIGVCLFASAYMAEIVRGGLQAIPKGQYEAAESMGLNYWQSMNLIILPQALKLMIPNIVGNFIGLLKDTTLVSIIGLYDMLLMIKTSGTSNKAWNGMHTEPLFLGAVFFFIICYMMSKYSQRLERKLATDHRN